MSSRRQPRNELILGVVFLCGGLGLAFNGFLLDGFVNTNGVEAFLSGLWLMSGLALIEIWRLRRKMRAMNAAA